MILKKFKNKLLLLLLSIFILPLSAFAYSKEVVLGGENVGIKVYSDGVLVVGFYDVDGKSPGRDAGLKVGDSIIQVEDISISSIDDLSKVIDSNTSSFKIVYLRNGKKLKTSISLKKDRDGALKTGLYVKDSITGIGTLTFIDPNTNIFGALGHEVSSKDTGQKFDISRGKIYSSYVTSIDKSDRLEPGGKNATFDVSDVIGTIFKNEKNGIYGKYQKTYDKTNLIKTANDDEIELGKAYIYTVVDGNNKEKFEINILSIDKNHDTKNLLFEVTDKRLLNKTNGIVQGMSGSPIVQNNKIIGAVTHVVVDKPEKGYGILISRMLKEAEKGE